ncbi:helix-turn-helix transcriptional regulator [Chromobacterium piscinae]|uniref:helix-turn-helix transcriptional regulator n=1 Tax=Chromobacterium piscinae TaxID=686831 RepID=UPI003D1816E5
MNTLKEARKRKGLTQSQLAVECGCSQGWIVQMEQGKGLPSPDLAKRIAETLQIPVMTLLFPNG